ncbi:MAG: RagB/SusD family nutrient uptake outer membrane protein [Mediterranea sp.]|nr:RagB/SusD family nutrient uptake outer membrane protein [Mediterranea sp.]
MKKKLYTLIALIGTLTLSGCVGDLNQYPHEEETSESVYNNAANYRAVLGKIYTSMVTAGQEKGGGNADLSSNSGYDYMRCFFNLQECGTDELASTWLSGDNVAALTYISWDANDPWVSDMYYRLYYNIVLCNELIRNATDDRIGGFSEQERAEIASYRAEARFMRALFYYHALDLFRYIPFADENSLPTDLPPRYTPQQTFDYIESELNAALPDMLDRASCPYGRASKGAAYTLLAKLYLNAETYTGTPKYTECVEACKQAIAQGYTLESDYAKLFNADNDKRAGGEIIFILPVDATHTVSWGASTYIVCGAVSNASDLQIPADYGVTSGWGSFRARGELPSLFAEGATDQRYRFFTDGQTKDLPVIDDQANGYFVTKWTNLTDDGAAASNTADGGVNTDYPLFRLADVYLMMTEAMLRGGTGTDRATVLGYVNDLQRRAYGDDTHAKGEADLTLDFVLKERARELYWEGHRRTDLVRYGLFTTASYLWQWKGGELNGKAVDSRYNIYPIPQTELTANPNLHNENY